MESPPSQSPPSSSMSSSSSSSLSSSPMPGNQAACASHRFQKVVVPYALPCAQCGKSLCGTQQLSWKCLYTLMQRAYQWEFWNTGMLCTSCDKIYHNACLAKISEFCAPKPPAEDSPSLLAGEPPVPLIKSEENWVLEDGHSEWFRERVRFGNARASQPYLEHNPELSSWFHHYFLGKEYEIIVTEDPNANSLILATLTKEPVVDASTAPSPFIYRGIVWMTNGPELWTIPAQREETLHAEDLLALSCGKKELAIQRVDESDFSFFENQLKIIEREQSRAFFKFGVVYRRPGQSENEMFSNQEGSASYDRFLQLIGERVDLVGFNHYSGGLDTKTSGTGDHSYFTVFHGAEIMYHVSTLLPFQPNNPQQIERKRFIGNDIVVIVFEDGEPDPNNLFSPELFTSNFMFVYVLISPMEDPLEKSKTVYRVQLTYHDDVQPFGPDLPNPSFLRPEELREFLLCKLINAEIAVLDTDYFKLRRVKAILSVMEHIKLKYTEFLQTQGSTPKKLHRKDVKKPLSARISGPIPELVGDDAFNLKGMRGRRTSQSGARSVTPTSGSSSPSGSPVNRVGGHHRTMSSSSLPSFSPSPVGTRSPPETIPSKLKWTTTNSSANAPSDLDSSVSTPLESPSESSSGVRDGEGNVQLDRRPSLP